MPLSLAFWVLMIVWLAMGFWSLGPNWKTGFPNLLLFILLALIGWKVFGAAIHS